MPGSNTRKRRTSLNEFLWVVPVIDPFVYLRYVIESTPYVCDVRIVNLLSMKHRVANEPIEVNVPFV